jgi:HAE1 family hydrophobic/amphiphilic exporter-1
MSLPNFSVRNRVLVNLLFVLAAFVGAIAYTSARVDVYPDVSFDQGQIVIAWPGASPEEIESSVTRKIEEEIRETKGVTRIVSSSERNQALIDVKFREDLTESEFESAFADLRARVQRVGDLPEDAEEPVITKISVNELYPLIQVVVAERVGAQVPRPILREVASDLREALRKVPGVQRVSDIGIPDPEWRILLDPGRLRSADLTVIDVADALQLRHRNIAAGTASLPFGEVALLAQGEMDAVESLLDLNLSRQDGQPPILLRDVARIEVGLKENYHRARFDGRSCMTLSIAKTADGDSIKIREALGEALTAYERSTPLPEGVELTTTIDTTKILKGRIRVLVDNLLFGVALVFLVLWAFIGARNAGLAIIGIPFSFLLGYAFLSLFGISINAITLFSLMLVSGMVVDDAIVVLENIYRRIEGGEDLRSAVVKGTEEVFWPVVTSTLTTLAAFLPMLVMEGVTGEFMSIIPNTVMAVLAASLIECLIIMPAHYLHWGSRARTAGKSAPIDRLLKPVEAAYLWSLQPFLKRPWIMLIVVFLLTGLSIRVAKDLPTDLFPSDFQAFFCNLTLDPEYGIESTSEAVKEVERRLANLVPNEVESFTTSVGVTFTQDNQVLLKPNVAQLLVYVAEKPGVDAASVIAKVRRLLEPLTEGKQHREFTRIVVDEFKDGPPTGKPVAVRVAGPDYGENLLIARQIEAHLRTLPGVLTPGNNLEEGPAELHYVPDQPILHATGVPFATVARCLFIANEGQKIGELLPPGLREPRELRVKLAPEHLEDAEVIGDLRVRASNGRTYPLNYLTRRTADRGPSSLYHYDGARVVLVTADLDSKLTDAQTVNTVLGQAFRDIPRKHPGVTLTFGGEFEETKKSFDSLYRAFAIAVVLIFTILAAQFRSYSLPLVIMSVVPFSFVGVVLGLGVLGFPFTIMAFIAIVGLSGVVVNDSLVLLDFIVRYRAESPTSVDAVRKACRTRLRAILLTTVTTVFGLLPMALGFTGKSKVWSPFAATITFGLSLAMFLTLYLVPSVYLLIERFTGARREEVVE